MWNIRMHSIVYELSSSEKKERKKERQTKKEDEQNRNFARGFLERDKGYRKLYSRFSNGVAKGCSL